jgi:hypothetical protein
LAKKKLFDLSSTSSTSPFASWRGHYFYFTVCFQHWLSSKLAIN